MPGSFQQSEEEKPGVRYQYGNSRTNVIQLSLRALRNLDEMMAERDIVVDYTTSLGHSLDLKAFRGAYTLLASIGLLDMICKAH